MPDGTEDMETLARKVSAPSRATDSAHTRGSRVGEETGEDGGRQAPGPAGLGRPQIQRSKGDIPKVRKGSYGNKSRDPKGVNLQAAYGSAHRGECASATVSSTDPVS